MAPTHGKVHAQVQAILDEAYTNMPEGVLVPCIKIVYFQRSRTAGRAKGRRSIEINTDLAEKYPDQLRDTVLHELAHLMVRANHNYRCKPHGSEWQDMMYLLGIEPERCHRMYQSDVPVVRHNKHHYRCGCGDHYMKTGRHNKHVIYGVEFTCRKCGTNLEYQGNG
jgi:SprT protein